MSRRVLALLAAFVLAATLLVDANPAGAASPFRTYEVEVASPGIRVSGTYTPLVGNFTGNRATDILWYAPGTATDALWVGTDTDGVFTKSTLRINGTYTPIVGDFSGDSYSDIIWYAPGAAADTLWTSVEGASVFSPTSLSVNGTYRPTVLPARVPSPPIAAARSQARSGKLAGQKDEIVWLRDGGTFDDVVWSMANAPAGAHTSTMANIPGSPQLIPLSLDNDAYTDMFVYTPGAGYDAAWRRTGPGTFAATGKSVTGTYQPAVIPDRGFDHLLWVGPGTRSDTLWRNSGGTLTTALLDPVNATGKILSTGDGYAYAYDAAGEDTNIIVFSGRVLDSLNTDVPSGATPLVGDFDFNGTPDAFFYFPGTGQERLYLGYNGVG